MSTYSGAGVYEKSAHKIEGRSTWLKPKKLEEKDQPTLKLFNSLTNRLDEFVPMKNRTMNWYNCGPTVYDHSHVGHARNYLECDIVRRVLTDYFHYDVVFHTNITDIDDKIILKARRNFLVKKFQDTVSAANEVVLSNLLNKIKSSVEIFEQKLKKSKQQIEDKVSDSSLSTRLRNEATEEEKQLELKIRNFSQTKQEYTKVLSSGAVSKEVLFQLIDIVFDPLASLLDKEKGESITDQKIFKEHSATYEKSFMTDMKALNIREPDVLTRVTEYIPQIISFTQTLLDNGLAYASNGSVYMDLSEFKKRGFEYRKLDPGNTTSARELEESEGALSATGEKKGANDFALWKAKQPGAPFWEAPFGDGRPGWHIECSVVASDIFPGVPLDIHSGGEDLKFPHHDNELAQSEACLYPDALPGKQWVNYFTHVGHLHIQGLKMSKSLKNFITIRECLKHHSARQVRLLVLLNEREKRINFSDQTVEDAKAKESTLKNFFSSVKFLLREERDAENIETGLLNNGKDRILLNELVKTQEAVHLALLNNIDTKTSMLSILDLISKSNIYIQEVGDKGVLNLNLLRKIALYCSKICGVFGLIDKFDDFSFSSRGEEGDVNKEELLAPYLETFVLFRDKIRNLALFSENLDPKLKHEFLSVCDGLRDKDLITLGVRLEDRKDKSAMWKLEDPKELMKEIEEKKREVREKKADKIRGKIKRTQELMEKADSASKYVPENYLQNKYSGSILFDPEGIPLAEIVDGVEKKIAKSRLKALNKEKRNFTQAYEKTLKLANNDLVSYMQRLRREIEQCQEELKQLGE
eukprot:maker-scaffold_3-snap-gene-4.39-mRNA-1 protein AED:0.22 eAED:0.22 QI:0/0/0/0.66/1/1/3/0/810